MSDLDDEFSENGIDVDICNTKFINIEENEEGDMDNNDEEDLEVQNNESNEGQEDDDGGKKKMKMKKVD